MLLSLKILEKMVDISDIEPEEIADRLTMSTAETEGLEKIYSHFETIYTAKLKSVEKHPDADKLTLCEVTTGDKDFQVVCGATNHKTGDIVALAKVGTVFSPDFVIKKSKIRGVESLGMLCSEKELGLSQESEGILIFPQDTEIGLPLTELYGEQMDMVIEIDNKSITHRPDLWGHRGFAWELGALFNKEVKEPVDFSLIDTLKNEDTINIKIHDSKAAPRYSALVVKNIKIEESPLWLQARLKAIGIRPINNIVDITNYVMAEIGEPMHAFDRSKLEGDTIHVRFAEKGESIITLDGTSHELTEEDIVIADDNGPIALAGVMGGENSEISQTTREIVLEAANFNPVNIRKTAHRFDSRTDAAMRFEKSLSPELTVHALLRCYELIKEIIPEAEATSQILDAYPLPLEEIEIKITTDHIRKKLGHDIGDDRIKEILSSLRYDLKESGEELTIGVPHFRATKDISIAADIVEEVGRIFGYDNIPPRAPLMPCEPPIKNRERLFERKVKEILSKDLDLTEVMGYSFTGEDILNKLKINEDLELRLRNPLSSEQDRLRRSLIPNMVSFILYNQRFHETFDIFEVGRTYIKEDRNSQDLAKENLRTAGVIFMKKPETPLFYEAKYITVELLEKLNIKKYKLTPASQEIPPYAHPGRTMKLTVDGKDAGYVFELHPETGETFEIQGRVAIFDIDLDILFKAKKNPIKFSEIQKFPEVPFEISVIAERETYSEKILSIIRNTNRKYITDAKVISVYEGKPIKEGYKSVSIKTIFSDSEKTMEPETIDSLQNSIMENLKNKGFEIR